MDSKDKAALVLRLGLAFVFVYVAISAFMNPLHWVGFIPDFLRDKIDGENLLLFHDALLLVLAIWILWGKKLFYASILSSLVLFGIVVFNMRAFDIVFRDLAILAMAIALAILNYKE